MVARRVSRNRRAMLHGVTNQEETLTMKRNQTRLTGAALERFINRWGLTKQQAADYLGTSPRMIYFYIAGKYKMSATIGLLIKALDENWTLKRER